MSFNRETRWAKGLVNLNQTREERRAKYKLVRSLGGSVANAERMRDWRRPKIERAYGLNQKGRS